MSVRFVITTKDDESTLHEWINADPWHSYKDAVEWWTSGGYLTFKLVDEKGTVVFVRLDRDLGTLVRLHAQFAPSNVVSENRTAVAITRGIRDFISHAVSNGVTGIVTELMSPKLVSFMCSPALGFKKVEGTEKDYLLMFSEGK